MTLQEIYDQHATFVWRTLRRLGVPPAEVNDAVQEVFLLVHANLQKFEGRSAMTTWLFTICRTVARDVRRRARRDLQHLEDVAAEDEMDLRADVSRSAEHRERLELLDTLLGTMEGPQRTVFILFEIEKLSGEEISQALGIPIGTAYSRLTLARDAFRRALSRTEARQRFATERAGGQRS
jgi:RNA polymerase sigma-70 factor, ECF subfamily